MNVVFRVDASIEMGTGHVMRCLTLADVLKGKGGQCYFICREHHGHMIDQILDRGHHVYLLLLNQRDRATPEKTQLAHEHWLGCKWLDDAQQTVDRIDSLEVDWLIVDHYTLDERWEKRLRPFCKKIMVIDDLADRHHDCDLLLDQTFGRSSKDYEQLVPADCTILTGAKYALLRPEFSSLRNYSLERRKIQKLEHLLISMGGIDKDNVTGGILCILNECVLPEGCHITVVLGEKSPWLNDVMSQVKTLQYPVVVKANVSNMAQLMADSDLAIGAAGSTSWERCCLGLPALMLVLAENQKLIADNLNMAGAVIKLNSLFEPYFSENFMSVLSVLNENRDAFKQMSVSAATVTDGQGVFLIADKLLGTD